MSRFIDERFSATARSRSGHSYSGSRVATATHILDIPAELSALVRAVHQSDFAIEEVTATIQEKGPVSPLVLKVLADHTARTGIPIRYVLCAAGGEVLFETRDAREALPFYRSPGGVLEALAGRTFATAKVESYDGPVDEELRRYAIAGITRNFPVRDGASGYGAALRTTGGEIYFGGQYSAFDERLGVHAEMAVIARALLDGAAGFTHIGVASSKFPDSIAPPCGACRQFILEAATATGSAPMVHLFTSRGNAQAVYSLDELLPIQWTNRK